MNSKLVDFMVAVEGKRHHAYEDAGGHWTIGIGHKLTDDEFKSGQIMLRGKLFPWRRGLNDIQINILVSQDLEVASSAVEQYVTIPLTENQRIALISFVFNIGERAFKDSKTLQELNASYDSFLEWHAKWIHAGEQRLEGLVYRRQLEAELFMKNESRDV